MAGNDATSTELFPGWSSVVHQPADEPEESDLPSTVDIAAFSTGLTVEPNNTTQNDEDSDSESDSEADSSNSGTDASQSGSQSDSSDSDSSSSSQSSSRSPSPQEFSVTSSQTNGLRLTIATVRKPSPTAEKNMKKPVANKPSSSSSSDSTDSDSDSEDSEPVVNNKTETSVKNESVTKNESVAKIESTKGEVSIKNNSAKSLRRTSRLRARPIEKKENKVNDKQLEKSTKIVKKETTNVSIKTGGKARQRPRRSRRFEFVFDWFWKKIIEYVMENMLRVYFAISDKNKESKSPFLKNWVTKDGLSQGLSFGPNYQVISRADQVLDIPLPAFNSNSAESYI